MAAILNSFNNKNAFPILFVILLAILLILEHVMQVEGCSENGVGLYMYDIWEVV